MVAPLPEGSSLKVAVRAAIPAPLWTALRRLRIQVSDPMAGAWYDRDWAEPPSIELLRRHQLRQGAVVFNIGAHQGVVALILAGVVGPTGSVVAVEAMSFNAAAAVRNRDLNRMSHLTILNAAVGETNGRVRFDPSLNGAIDSGSNAWGKVSVEALTIDELSRRYGAPNVLFVDIEGFECRAFKGATETLARRPDCVVEVHVGCGLESFGGSLEDLLRFFPPDAYTLYMAPEDEESHAPPGCRPFDRSDVMVKGRFQLIAVGRR